MPPSRKSTRKKSAASINRRKKPKTPVDSLSSDSNPDDPEPVNTSPSPGVKSYTNTIKDEFQFSHSSGDESVSSSPIKSGRKMKKSAGSISDFSDSSDNTAKITKFLETSSDDDKAVIELKKPEPKKEEKSDQKKNLPVIFNQYYRHTCKLAAFTGAKQISGQDNCSPDHPAELPLEKVKLHYVVHYLTHGTWDHIVPEEDKNPGGKIESYVCNICQKKFKNHLEKKEYPGRGSVLCHLATDHGMLLDAMRNEKEVDLTHDILILAHNDKQFKSAYEKGVDVASYQPDQLVTTKESIYWRLASAKEKSDSLTPPPSIAPVAKPKAIAPSTQTVSTSLTRPKPLLLECPHCDELQGNDDGPNLRLHIFHHYKDHWADRIAKLSKTDRAFFCDLCPRKKKITGATLDGTKTAVVCHFAIQHYELRGVLEKDNSISKEFISDLYWDHDHPGSGANTYFQSQSKIIKSQSATPSSKVTKPRKSKIISSSESEGFETSDMSSFEMSLSDDESETEVEPKKKSNETTAALPGEANPNYIRKRGKINFSLDSDEDVASDDSWNFDSSKQSSSKKRRELKKPNDKTSTRQRVLPRRTAAQKKSWSFLENDDED